MTTPSSGELKERAKRINKIYADFESKLTSLRKKHRGEIEALLDQVRRAKIEEIRKTLGK